jgi:hypothetical protein
MRHLQKAVSARLTEREWLDLQRVKHHHQVEEDGTKRDSTVREILVRAVAALMRGIPAAADPFKQLLDP